MRWLSSDGTWVVELIHRTNSNGRDGHWLLVTHHGFKVGEARDWDGVARLGVDPGDPRPGEGTGVVPRQHESNVQDDEGGLVRPRDSHS